MTEGNVTNMAAEKKASFQNSAAAPKTFAEMKAMILTLYATHILETYKMDKTLFSLAPVSNMPYPSDPKEYVAFAESLMQDVATRTLPVAQRLDNIIAELEMLAEEIKFPPISKKLIDEKKARATVLRENLEGFKSILDEDTIDSEEDLDIINKNIARLEMQLKIHDPAEKMRMKLLYEKEYNEQVKKVNHFSDPSVDKAFQTRVAIIGSFLQKPGCIHSEVVEEKLNELKSIRDVLYLAPKYLKNAAKIYEKLCQEHMDELNFQHSRHGSGKKTVTLRDAQNDLVKFPLCYDANEHRRIMERFESGDRIEPTRFVPLLYSAPGVGKTAILSSLAMMLESEFIPISVPQTDETVISGIPVVNEVKNTIGMNVLETIAKAISTPSYILLDEMLRASSPNIYNQLLRFLMQGEIGTHKLHPMTFIVGATNRPEDDPNVTVPGAAANSRMAHIELADEKIIKYGWYNWGRKHYQGDGPTAEFFHVVSSFLLYGDGKSKEASNMFIKPVSEIDEQHEYAFPTPRGWTNVIDVAGKLFRDGHKNVAPEKITAIVQQYVGRDAAQAFKAFFNTYSLIPSVDELCDRISNVGFSTSSLRNIDAALIFDSPLNITVDDAGKGQCEILYSMERIAENIKAVYGHRPEIQNAPTAKERNEKLNELVRKMYPEPIEETLKKIMENYQEIWKCSDGDIKQFQSPAIQWIMGKRLIESFTGEFDAAIAEKRPLNGDKLENIFKLIVTYPMAEARFTMLNELFFDHLMNFSEIKTGINTMKERNKHLTKYGVEFTKFTKREERNKPGYKPEKEIKKWDPDKDPRTKENISMKSTGFIVPPWKELIPSLGMCFDISPRIREFFIPEELDEPKI